MKKCGSQTSLQIGRPEANDFIRFLAHSQNEEKSYIHHHLPKKDFPQNAVCFCNLLKKNLHHLEHYAYVSLLFLSAEKLRFSAVIIDPNLGGHQTMQLYGKFEGFLLFFVRGIWVGVIL